MFFLKWCDFIFNNIVCLNKYQKCLRFDEILISTKISFKIGAGSVCLIFPQVALWQCYNGSWTYKFNILDLFSVSHYVARVLFSLLKILKMSLNIKWTWLRETYQIMLPNTGYSYTTWANLHTRAVMLFFYQFSQSERRIKRSQGNTVVHIRNKTLIQFDVIHILCTSWNYHRRVTYLPTPTNPFKSTTYQTSYLFLIPKWMTAYLNL